jgi:hypothetical protein
MTGVVNGLTVANIVGINNAITQPSTNVICTGTIASPDNFIVCSNTTTLIIEQEIVFKTPISTAGSFNPGSVYTITVVGTTDFTSLGASANEVGIIFTCNSDPQTGNGQAFISNVGGVDTGGTVYFVASIDSGTEFTIKDQYGVTVELTTSGDGMVGVMGGNIAIRVETGINHNLTENALVRLDGILGSVQLNNNTYYAKIITDKQIYLYGSPYNPTLNAVNDPITFASSYISGGYVWIDQLFTVADTFTKFTTSGTNRITVNDATGIIIGTPIYFTAIGAITGENLLGNIEANTEYYVLSTQPETSPDNFIVGNEYEITATGDTDWNTVAGTTDTLAISLAVGQNYEITFLGTTDWNIVAGTSSVTYAIGDLVTAVSVGTGTGTADRVYAVGNVVTVAAIDAGTTGVAEALQEFTISAQRYPDEAEFVLADATGEVSVSQFQQVNVDRLWVTVNGYRVPSSSLRINPYNNLSILTTITTGDDVTITSMMPTATPNEEVYLLNVSTSNQAVVYRANTQTRTWLVHPLGITDTTIYLNDASRITDSIIQNVTTPAEVDGTYTIGLTANKNTICHVQIYNNTTSSLVDPANYSLATFEIAPVVVITAGVSEDDSLTITTLEGRLLYVNGEQIGFAECDLITNTVTGLVRGANGTGAQTYIPLYSEVFGIIPNNRMSSVDYSDTWNSYIYNTVDGDPLQISQTAGANFLRVDRN